GAPQKHHYTLNQQVGSITLQRDVIETFDDLDSMMHHIKTAQKGQSSRYSFQSIEDVNKYFGDISIESKFMSLLDINEKK
ncbi:hypothetical protein PXZ99_12650, partial [Klebsiella pneumoniae]